MIQQTGHLAPADKKLYAIRDVTATVESIPLIASSIVSKKIASGNKHIVFDVKVGDGAFMKNKKDGRLLALAMVNLVNKFGGEGKAVLTKMEEPLGFAVGNSIEVIEAIEILKGNGPTDVLDVSKALAVQFLLISKIVKTNEAAMTLINKAIETGMALKKFREMIVFQGGNDCVIDDYTIFPESKNEFSVTSNVEGYVTSLKAEVIGLASMTLGAGREALGDTIDLSAGIFLHKKIGDYVKVGESLCTCYWSQKMINNAKLEEAIRGGYCIDKEPIKKNSIIIDVVQG